MRFVLIGMCIVQYLSWDTMDTSVQSTIKIHMQDIMKSSDKGKQDKMLHACAVTPAKKISRLS